MHPLHKLYVQRTRSKLFVPVLAGGPPPSLYFLQAVRRTNFRVPRTVPRTNSVMLRATTQRYYLRGSFSETSVLFDRVNCFRKAVPAGIHLPHLLSI